MQHAAGQRNEAVRPHVPLGPAAKVPGLGLPRPLHAHAQRQARGTVQLQPRLGLPARGARCWQVLESPYSPPFPLSPCLPPAPAPAQPPPPAPRPRPSAPSAAPHTPRVPTRPCASTRSAAWPHGRRAPAPAAALRRPPPSTRPPPRPTAGCEACVRASLSGSGAGGRVGVGVAGRRCPVVRIRLELAEPLARGRDPCLPRQQPGGGGQRHQCLCSCGRLHVHNVLAAALPRRHRHARRGPVNRAHATHYHDCTLPRQLRVLRCQRQLPAANPRFLRKAPGAIPVLAAAR